MVHCRDDSKMVDSIPQTEFLEDKETINLFLSFVNFSPHLAELCSLIRELILILKDAHCRIESIIMM